MSHTWTHTSWVHVPSIDTYCHTGTCNSHATHIMGTYRYMSLHVPHEYTYHQWASMQCGCKYIIVLHAWERNSIHGLDQWTCPHWTKSMLSFMHMQSLITPHLQSCMYSGVAYHALCLLHYLLYEICCTIAKVARLRTRPIAKINHSNGLLNTESENAYL